MTSLTLIYSWTSWWQEKRLWCHWCYWILRKSRIWGYWLWCFPVQDNSMLLTFSPPFTARLFFNCLIWRDIYRTTSAIACIQTSPPPQQKRGASVHRLNVQNTLTTLIITISIIFTVLAFRRSHYQRGSSRFFPQIPANSEETRRLFYRRQFACSSFALRWMELSRYMQQSHATFSFSWRHIENREALVSRL